MPLACSAFIAQISDMTLVFELALLFLLLAALARVKACVRTPQNRRILHCPVLRDLLLSPFDACVLYLRRTTAANRPVRIVMSTADARILATGWWLVPLHLSGSRPSQRRRALVSLSHAYMQLAPLCCPHSHPRAPVLQRPAEAVRLRVRTKLRTRLGLGRGKGRGGGNKRRQRGKGRQRERNTPLTCACSGAALLLFLPAQRISSVHFSPRNAHSTDRWVRKFPFLTRTRRSSPCSPLRLRDSAPVPLSPLATLFPAHALVQHRP